MNKDEYIKELEAKVRKLTLINKYLKRKLFCDCLTKLRTKTWMMEKYKNNDIDNYLVFVDANKLKTINDKFGHEEGNRFLVRIANFLKTFKGETVRYGGDEFLFITKDEKEFYRLLNSNNPDITCGGAKPGEYSTFAEGINLADQNMYANKKYLENQNFKFEK